MKLRMLAVAAGFVVLPAIAVAQTPTDTTAKDTTMKMPAAPAAPAAAVTTAAKDSTLEPSPYLRLTAPPARGAARLRAAPLVSRDRSSSLFSRS
jgi:hypothetical protein